MNNIYVSELWTYPVKSCRGFSLEEAQIKRRGFAHDRRWLVVDENGRFISQREFSTMALIETEIQANSLILKALTMSDLRIDIPQNTEKISVQIWDDVCEAELVSSEANAWLSQYLNTACRLVYMPESSERQVDTKYAQIGQITGFTDAFPFLLISEASLMDLNNRLEEPVLMNRFRPNLVISGVEPYAEDTWKLIRIGEIIFEVAKPCARCIMTTVEQSTGMMGKEPLKTLSTFRKMNNKVLFGQNLLHLQIGKISLGQKVEILEFLDKTK